jgi:hypothetical protein
MRLGSIEAASAGATIFVTEPPASEYHDGMFFITYTVGTTAMRFCMLPSVYLKAFKRCSDANSAFQQNGCEVCPIVASPPG